MILSAFIDADASNASASYSGGIQQDTLAAGTYRNVILTVSGK